MNDYWKVILATMVIFGTGVVTGGLLVRHSERVRAPRLPHAAASPRPGTLATNSAGGMRLELLRRMQRELDLTPEQHDRIEHLLKESQERTRKIMEPVNPQLRQELQQTKEEFRQVLTPEQRARFDEMLKHHPRRPDGSTNSPRPAPQPPA